MSLVLFLLALACIVLGFVVALFDVHILFEPIAWFVASLAISLLEPVIPARSKA